MKFLGHALVLALGLPRAAESAVLQSSGDCAVPLSRQECEDAAGALEARWNPDDINPNLPFSINHIPGGCFAKVSPGGKEGKEGKVSPDGNAKALRWNEHKEEGTGCGSRRPCVCGPSCEPDADLAARYGPQLCHNEIEALFDRKNGTFIQTNGMQQFQKDSAPLSDGFTTRGLVELDLEQAISVCATKCANDPGCDAVSVIVEEAYNVKPYTGMKDVRCVMVNNDLDGDAYLSSSGQCSCQEWVTFEKKTSTPLPKFEEDVMCDIDRSNLEVAAYCTLEQISNATICDPLLTDDWNQFMAPGILCMAYATPLNPGDAVPGCMECLLNLEDGSITDVCRENAMDNTTLLLDPDKCATECLGNTCLEDLEKTLLCLLGSPGIGLITGRNFTCPEVE